MEEGRDDSVREMKRLISKWKHAKDPESLWILRLLSDAVERKEAERKARAGRSGTSAVRGRP